MDKENLIFIVADLVDQGYKADFKLKCNLLYLPETNVGFRMEEFEIDFSYKIIGDSNEPDADVQRLFAITTKEKGLKGLLIDTLNNMENIESNEVQRKFQNTSETQVVVESVNEKKYNLKKITKQIYLQNPNRYSFRKGFPDFPACPFGNSFEALGWDKEDRKYVWLVSSVLKDKTLEIENY